MATTSQKADANDARFRKSIEMFLRIMSIKARLGRKPYITHINELKEFLEEEGYTNISERNIQRDIQSLNNHFGLDVGFDKDLKRYTLSEPLEEEPDLATFDGLLDMVDQYTKQIRKLQGVLDGYQVIQFEHQTSLASVKETLVKIAHAIKNSFKINFYYKPFLSDSEKEFQIEPYLVLENKNRWYVTGFDMDSMQIKTFGIERITALEISKLKFTNKRGFNISEIRRKNYGIYNMEGEPQEIILRFSKNQAAYVLTNPLHESQEIVNKPTSNDANEAYTFLKVTLIPNYEFYMQLMSFNAECLVIEPAIVKETLITMAKKMLANYQ